MYNTQKEIIEAIIKSAENANIATVLEKLYQELDKLDRAEYYSEVLGRLDKLSLSEKDREEVEGIKVVMADFIFEVSDFRKYWDKYISKYRAVIDKDMIKLKFEIENLKARYNLLLGRYKQITEDKEEFNDSLKTIQDMLFKLSEHMHWIDGSEEAINQFKEYFNTLTEAIRILKENTNLIAGSVGARKRMVANNQPVALKTNIKDDELIEYYQNNGFKITDEMVRFFSSKEKITYDGLRKRLQRLGVWRGHSKEE